MDKNTRILVVDDNENLRNTIQALLSKNGYSVDLAVNGLEAIQKSKEAPYNVILINIQLPDMESEQLLDLINDEVQTTRKIVVTGCRSMKSTVTALNKNTNAYLIKPLSFRSF